MWVERDLTTAETLLEDLRVALSRTEVAPTDSTIEIITNSLANDLDTPSAIKALKDWLADTNSGLTGGSPGELSRAVDTLLGIAF
jgi:L-cysteine:1D-myo-inositol 2-amino-2-deoxy-alpha-D-glucopyranoside ligase